MRALGMICDLCQNDCQVNVTKNIVDAVVKICGVLYVDYDCCIQIKLKLTL